MTKPEKIQMINDALGRSGAAEKQQAKASILPDGRIEYQMLSGNGRYVMKATFREVLNLMHGKDMQLVMKALGKGR